MHAHEDNTAPISPTVTCHILEQNARMHIHTWRYHQPHCPYSHLSLASTKHARTHTWRYHQPHCPYSHLPHTWTKHTWRYHQPHCPYSHLSLASTKRTHTWRYHQPHCPYNHLSLASTKRMHARTHAHVKIPPAPLPLQSLVTCFNKTHARTREDTTNPTAPTVTCHFLQQNARTREDTTSPTAPTVTCHLFEQNARMHAHTHMKIPPAPLSLQSLGTCLNNNTNYYNICPTRHEKLINMASDLSPPVAFPSHRLRMLERNQYAHTDKYWLGLTNNALNIHYVIMWSQVELTQWQGCTSRSFGVM